MEIRISADNMLFVLVEAGIDETEAKAIIFDLLQAPGDLERKQVSDEIREAGWAKLRKSKKRSHADEDEQDEQEEYEDEDGSEEEEDEDEEEDDDEEEDVKAKPKSVRKTVIKKPRPKRINFSAFGGPAEPILG